MKRVIYFVYGVVCYVMFFAVYAYMAGFVGNLIVPKSIDSVANGSVGNDSIAEAVAVDVGLLLVFGLQHSIMARPAFKRVWTRIVPTEIERSTYVLASNLVVAKMDAPGSVEAEEKPARLPRPRASGGRIVRS